jgi:hypothetical protein
MAREAGLVIACGEDRFGRARRPPLLSPAEFEEDNKIKKVA